MRKVFVTFLFLYLAFPLVAFGADDVSARRNAADLYKKIFAKCEAIPRELADASYEGGDDGLRKLSEKQLQLFTATEEIAKLLVHAQLIDLCEWEDPFFSNPLNWEMPPGLARSRQVMRFTILRARHLLHEGKSKEAIDELFAAMRMGRQLGRGGTVIYKLIQLSIDAGMIEAMATLSPLIPADLRSDLPRRVDAMIQADTLQATMDRESRFVSKWMRVEFPKDPEKFVAEWEVFLRKAHGLFPSDKTEFDPAPYRRFAMLAKDDKEKFFALVDEYDRTYAELSKVYAAPSDQAVAKFKAWQKTVNSSNVLVSSLATDLFGMMSGLPLIERRLAVRMAMFRTGIAYLNEGDAALEKHRVPKSEDRFKMVKSEKEFELQHQFLRDDEEALKLKFPLVVP